MTTTADELADEVLERTGDDADVLRKLLDRLDDALSAGALERTVRLWDISNAELGRMFGVSRQAASTWLQDGPPAARRDQVELLGQATDLLDRWVKRERIPAVVRRPVDVLDGRTRLEVALDGEFERLRDELRDTFDLARVAP
ncbi:MAG: hypothetical protein R3343_10710 [Nitriliruptorales bacterium]|nr:hypothetical protein [Nitriliruptorales bacterium]